MFPSDGRKRWRSFDAPPRLTKCHANWDIINHAGKRSRTVARFLRNRVFWLSYAHFVRVSDNGVSSRTWGQTLNSRIPNDFQKALKMHPRGNSNLPRRQILKGAAASSLVWPATSCLPAAAMLEQSGSEPHPSASGVIQRENAQPGALDWQLTRVRVQPSGGVRCPWIEGYCSRQSVAAGESLDIMVSTNPPQRFVIEIFRSGYYDGRGARLMAKLGPFKGQTQPTPDVGEKRIRECLWQPATSLVIPDDWPSGVYLGRLTTLSDESGFGYWQSYVVFIVRDDRPADILLQCSDNTWQCYNQWPDNYSVYTHPKGNQGPWADVSFDRPYGKYPQIFENPQTIGSGEWLCFEFPLAYWLEKHGYDVTYCSNSDMLTPERVFPISLPKETRNLPVPRGVVADSRCLMGTFHRDDQS